MLDADFALDKSAGQRIWTYRRDARRVRAKDGEHQTTVSDPLEADVFPESELLSPEKRLGAIASILAVAVLRSKVRKAASRGRMEDIEESSGTAGEGLD